jgi:hypothetical protein
MAKKENKGGVLSNEQIEQDNKVKGKTDEKGRSYVGSQDTGDDIVRPLGNEVQRNDGVSQDDEGDQ